METKDLDVVYIVKRCSYNEELRYSLRSLKNLPHRRVFIFGYIPSWVQNIWARPMLQKGINKWDKAADSLLRVADEKDLSENFILFNDDFFVMRPQIQLPYYIHKTLEGRIQELVDKGLVSGYTDRLQVAANALKSHHKSAISYELHLPMIFNREKYRKIWELYPGVGAKRSLYGNEYNVGGVEREDCKIYVTDAYPDMKADFLSTSDESFRNGLVGKMIKEHFNIKCSYER